MDHDKWVTSEGGWKLPGRNLTIRTVPVCVCVCVYVCKCDREIGETARTKVTSLHFDDAFSFYSTDSQDGKNREIRDISICALRVLLLCC